jgi:hypothetical protein
MDISLSDANAYFADDAHVRSKQWAGFDGKLKQAAITQATRQIGRATGQDITTDEIDEPLYRPDYAIFEQALHLLLTSQAIPNGEQNAPHWAGADGIADERRDAPPPAIHPEALSWLGGRSKIIYMTRG